MPSIFTQIIRGEMPAVRVYETERELAFLDIHPKSDGHTLVVPKAEVPAFHDLPPELAQSLIVTVQKVLRGVTQAMGTPHYNLVLNNGPAAGQVVFHVHFHIIPRYAVVDSPWGRGSQPGRDLEEVGERIRRAIAGLGPHS